ncbi:MAG TPA: hypothetical protein VHA52_01680 [Candidatus Babeliaceae bacterium]|nr:hypothetical protein [Candidatus Babeliaceae bacterium]
MQYKNHSLKNPKTKPRTFKKRALLLVVFILIVVLAFISYQHYHHSNSKGTSSSGGETINYTPPTAADKAQSENQKSNPPTASNTQKPNTSSSSSNIATSAKKKVTVTITNYNPDNSGNLTVNGFASGVVEDSGTCTLTLKNGGDTITKSRPAFTNATNMSCGQSSVPLSSLHSGTWQATLSYSSKTSVGASPVTSIQVK